MSDVSQPERKRKVLLIGWDAADWKVIHPLLDAGKMPVLESLIEGGVMGKLATLTPVLSPMLWTSIATGKRPYKHGILGFVEPNPQNEGLRPITNLSRKTKAIWNILGQQGLKSNIIGWWPSHPVEPINGVMVSNHFQQVREGSKEKGMEGRWPMMRGTIHPPELAHDLAKFRVHPHEVEPSQLLPFIPRAAEIDHQKDRHTEKAAKLLAECASVHACGTAVMQSEEWDFMGIYYDAIDHFCHGFMKFHPPRQAHVSEENYELYKDVVEGIYRFHDIMLGVTLKLAGDDTTVIVMSDHGFHPDHLRPKEIPEEPNGPAVEHSHLGIFVANGPGIKKDGTIFGANLLDITPTILTLFGLPVGEDMDGRVLTEIWEGPPDVETIPSWDEVEGDDGRHPAHFQYAPADDQALMKQLVDLGYVEAPNDDKQESARNAYRELQFNLARSFIDAGRHGDSIPVLEELVEDWPHELRFLNQLAFCYLTLDRPADARRVVDRIAAEKEALAKDLEERIPELTNTLRGIKHEALTEEQKSELRDVRTNYKAATAPNHYLVGCLLVAEDEPEKALEVLSQISPKSWDNPEIPTRIGHLYMSLNRPEEAEDCFKKALEIDPQSSRAYQGLLKLMLTLGRFHEAAEYGLSSVGLLYFSPVTHFLLGKALLGLKYYERAAEAFEVTLAQNPNYEEAYEILGNLYGTFLFQPEKGERYLRQASELALGKLKAKEAAEKAAEVTAGPVTDRLKIPESWAEEAIITIVSGLPRSGTSLMMQMLDAGGMVCLTDEVRKADENNPRGYYELESIKALPRKADVLEGAVGKAVKIVAPILPKLPSGETYRYRVIFMERDLDEVFASQAAMLKRLGKPPTTSEPTKMKRSYAKLISEVNDALSSREIPTMGICFRKTIVSPEETAKELNDYCGGTLDESAMMGVVDASLHRERK